MPAPKPPTWVFNVNNIRGLVAAFGNDQVTPPEDFVQFGGKEKFVRVVRLTGNEDKPHEDLDLTGATLTIAIGPRDKFPSTGSSIAYWEDPSSVSIPAGETAANVQTALNTLPVVIAEGGVTVVAKRAGYQITWNNAGARSLFNWEPGTLTPPSRTPVRRLVPGDVSNREVQLVEINQDYWAANSDWTTEATGTISGAVVTAGTATVRKVEKIEITGDPIGGKFRVDAPQAAVYRINAIQNTAALKAHFTFTIAGNTIASGDFFDIYDSTGPVRVYFNVGGAGPIPAAPAGGRVLEVTCGGLTDGDIRSALWATVSAGAADPGLEQASYDAFAVGWRTKLPGVYTEAQIPTFIPFTFGQGSNGRLGAKYFTLYDAYGQVGVWFNVNNNDTIPDEVAAMSRSIEVTGVVGNSTAAQVAAAIQVAIDADAEFTATVAANVVTVTDAKGGTRNAPSGGTSGIGIVQTRQGYLVSAVLDVKSTAATVRSALRNLYDVTRDEKPGLIQFLLVAAAPGEYSDITAANVSLQFPAIYKGKFSFNTATCFAAFSDAGDDVNELPATMEAQYQFPGEDPVKFYQANVIVNRALIDTTALTPVNILGSNYVTGSMAIPNGASYVDVVFPGGVAFPASTFQVVSASIENTVNTPPTDNLLMGIIGYKTTTGFRQYFSGPTSNGNSVYKYVARA